MSLHLYHIAEPPQKQSLVRWQPWSLKRLWEAASQYHGGGRGRGGSHDDLTDVGAIIENEQIVADRLHASMNRSLSRLGLEDEIANPHGGINRLDETDRYLLWAPVIKAMLAEMDELRAVVLFGDEKR